MVDYCESDISHHPHCLHGPMLLFCRARCGRKFYACAAFRDRKKCRSFRWIDGTSHPSGHVQSESYEVILQTYEARRRNFKRLLTSSIRKCYCHTCDLFISIDEKIQHRNHQLERKIDSTLLKYPSLLMKPIEQSKGESQFYFSDNTVKTLSNILSDLGITGILCVGCPRLHEHIVNSQLHCNVRSMLLDIDPRYLQFYDSDRFQMFNMFNCHLFDENGWEHINILARIDKVAIVADPPFGGRLEPLAYSFKHLISAIEGKKMRVRKDVLVLLILPYFMEPAVKKSFPDFHMLDFKVEYTNHRKFKKRENRGSAVRIFTNFPLRLFKLPAEEGYKHCAVCDRWVYKENRHCFKCNACTSKNGSMYKHCDKCRKCVKTTWSHCDTCNVCKLEQHQCLPVSTSNGSLTVSERGGQDIPEARAKKKRKLKQSKGKAR